MRYLSLLLLLLSDLALGQVTSVQRAEFRDSNLLGPYNSGFENGKQGWAASGGTFAVTSSSPLDGKTSAQWTPSTSGQTLDSTAISLPAGAQGNTCQASILYKGSDANTTFEVYDVTSTSVVSGTAIVLSPATVPSPVTVAFACPSSADSIKLRLTSTGSSAQITFDKAFLGIIGQEITGTIAAKNYISIGANSPNGWAPSGSGVTLAKDTSPLDLPDPFLMSAMTVTGVSGSTAYAFQNFKIDPSDYNKKLGFQFNQACGLAGAATAIANCATGNFQVQVFSCSVAWSGTPATTCSGTNTRLTLSTDVTSVSQLSAYTGTYRTTFDAPGASAPYIQIQIGLNSTNTNAIAVSNLNVGPGVVTQTAAVEPWIAYTPNTSGFSISTAKGQYRRVGDTLEVLIRIVMSGAATSSIGAISIPVGLTINTTALNDNTFADFYGDLLGWATAYLGTPNAQYTGAVRLNNATSIGFTDSGYNLSNGPLNFWGNTRPTTWTNGDIIQAFFKVPINEWSGGTTNVSENDPQFVCFDGTNTIYSKAGCSFPSTGPQTYTVTPLYPAQAGQNAILEYQNSSTGAWQPLMARDVNIDVMPYEDQNGVFYGAGAYLASPTSVVARFGQYSANNSTYGGTGTSWTTANSNGKWRVEIGVPGLAVGFSSANATNAGLVDTNTQTFAGSKTFNQLMQVAGGLSQLTGTAQQVVPLVDTVMITTSSPTSSTTDFPNVPFYSGASAGGYVGLLAWNDASNNGMAFFSCAVTDAGSAQSVFVANSSPNNISAVSCVNNSGHLRVTTTKGSNGDYALTIYLLQLPKTK